MPMPNCRAACSRWRARWTWLVNKHAPTQQVWLSRRKAGRHYAYDAGTGQWKDTRGGPDLIAHLSGELGVPLTWQPQ